jgi:predicted Zn-dependent protease
VPPSNLSVGKKNGHATGELLVLRECGHSNHQPTGLPVLDATRGLARELGRRRVACCSNLLREKKRELPMDRLAMLNEILAQNPNDAFARYGLAMEYSRAGEVEKALDEFNKLLTSNPEYTAGYFMAAQTLARASRNTEARKMLSDGIAAAKRTRNAHAQSEMEAMLNELPM